MKETIESGRRAQPLGLEAERHEKAPRTQGFGGLQGRLAATYSPTGQASSTIRAAGLNGRVRDGNGCVPRAKATNQIVTLKRPHLCVAVRAVRCGVGLTYASLTVLLRLDLGPFERPGRAWQPSSQFTCCVSLSSRTDHCGAAPQHQTRVERGVKRLSHGPWSGGAVFGVEE